MKSNSIAPSAQKVAPEAHTTIVSNLDNIREFLCEHTATDDEDWLLVQSEDKSAYFFNSDAKLEASIEINANNDFDFQINEVVIH